MDDAALSPILSELHQAAERLWEACAPLCPGLVLDVVPEIDSTNTALMSQGRRGDTWPTAMVAVRQTAGRGRRGRDWVAHPGDTLTFSLGLPLQLDAVPGGGSALSLAVGLALAEALDAGLRTHLHGVGMPPAIGLKWPNDLWLGERKLGGILIEATPAPGLPEGQRWVVIGVGLNVRSANSAVPVPGSACLPSPAPGLGEVWGWLVPALIRTVQAFERNGFAPLQAAYARRDVLRGRPVQLWTAAASLPATGAGAPAADQSGIAQGVDNSGALLVHTDQGLQRWHAGDVSVRPA